MLTLKAYTGNGQTNLTKGNFYAEFFSVHCASFFCKLCVIVEKLEYCMKCATIQYTEYQNKQEGLSVKGQPTAFQNEQG